MRDGKVRRASPTGGPGPAGRAGARAGRVALGPFWLWWRAARGEWRIAWWDGDAADGRGRTRSLGTGVRDRGPDGAPPPAALDALAAHYARWRVPEPVPAGQVLAADLLARWLEARNAAPPGGRRGERALADPARYAFSVRHWLDFLDRDRLAGHVPGAHSVDEAAAAVDRFVAWRLQAGVSPATVARDVAALRAAVNWAWRRRELTTVPFVATPLAPVRPRELTYTAEQVARMLEAARDHPARGHVHLYIMVALSTLCRSEAILEADFAQFDGGRFVSNPPGRAQTSKRRATVPVCPTLAPWVTGRRGPLIAVPVRLADGRVERRAVASIKRAYAGVLRDAGMVDATGRPIGSPNTLRHTVITEMHRRGVPEAQIDAAAGHSGVGTGRRNYTHLRPDYLAELVAGVEDWWAEVGRYTRAHLHSSDMRVHCASKVAQIVVGALRRREGIG